MNSDTKKLSRLVLLSALTLSMELAGLPQPATGPLVNMMLILTTLVINPFAGVALGAITPLVAALRGQLPALLIPMAPFIMAGNALFVVFFAVISNRFTVFGRKEKPLYPAWVWAGLLGGAVVKALWLYGAVRLALPLLLGRPVPPPLLAMMFIPQFITAVIGGVAAFLLFNILQRHFHLN